MTKEEAKLVLSRHLMQCGALMPIEWVHSNGDGSKTMEAFRLALDVLDGHDVTDKNVENKWISVNERMPKPLTKVLAINRYGDMMVGTYTEWGWMFPSYFEYITHWKQLPEPPGGE